MSKFTTLIENLVPDAQAVFRRFPLAILMALLLTCVVIAKANNWDVLNDDMMMRLAGGAMLAGYLSIILTLFGEGRGKTVSVLIKALIVGGALTATFFFRLLAFTPPMAIGAAILFVGSAPFWRQKRDDVRVWDFTHKLWIAVLFTVAGSVIYLMGLMAISGALKSLFSVNIRDLVEDWLLPIGFAFLAPMAWLSMLSRHDDEDEHDSLRNPSFISRAVGFLGTWILAPLTLIFALILVAYGVKIVMTGELPKGEIAALVTPFLIIGSLTWLILDPPFIQEKKLARWFSKAWFPLMIPAALLLAVSIFIRIGEYGWTIERYLLVLAAIWALGISLWFIFGGEKRRDIRIISGFAALLLAVGSFGPWGADSVSSMSQNSRLKTALISGDMLTDEGYLKPEVMIKWESVQGVKAKGALNYLIKQDKTKRINRFINPSEEFSAREEGSAAHNGLNYTPILERFGLDTVRMPSKYGHGPSQHYYNKPDGPTNIQGYDLMSDIQYGNFNKSISSARDFVKMGRFSVQTEKTEIVVKEEGKEVARKDIETWIRSQPIRSNNQIKLNPRLVLYEDGTAKIAIHFTEASYTSDKIENSYISAQFMILGTGVE